MKNKKVFLVILIIVIVLIIVLFNYFNKSINYKVISGGYSQRNIIISSYKEYKEYMKDSKEWNREYKKEIDSIKYNPLYFLTKSLAIVNINAGSSSDKFEGVIVSVDDNTISVKPSIKHAKGTTTDDIKTYLVVVEIGKNIDKIK